MDYMLKLMVMMMLVRNKSGFQFLQTRGLQAYKGHCFSPSGNSAVVSIVIMGRSPPSLNVSFKPSITVFTFFVFALLFPWPAISGPVSVHSISPNFTASYLGFVDILGAFLASSNGSFEARITNAKPESESYYVVVIHAVSNTIVWSANRNAPISKASELRFSSDGLALYNDTGDPVWSTPQNLSTVSSLQLLESGNLVLLDTLNKTVWQSFDFPTDVIVAGQKLAVGKSLVSSFSDEDLSDGDYKLLVGGSDAMLQWNGMDYWKMSMDTKAFPDTTFPVEYMVLNYTGVYLIAENGQTVIKIVLQPPNSALGNSSSLFIVKLTRNGVLTVVWTNRGSNQVEFSGPGDKCQIPFACGKLGVCTNGGSCQCAAPFHPDSKTNSNDCVPTDGSLVLPSSCNNSSSNGTDIRYLNLRDDLDYFSNVFVDPEMSYVNLSVCQNQCSMNCSCLAVFYSQNSGSCYMIRNYFGSLVIKSASNIDRLGYVKTIIDGNQSGYTSERRSKFPIMAVILLPCAGAILVAFVAALLLLKGKKQWVKNGSLKLGQGRGYSFSTDEESDLVSIPGLPVRFGYNELELATESFKNQIGAGGFGTVYKGVLDDGTEIAVKKITCLGPHGKREFLTEIAVIGKIHHVNLVSLKGFCSHKEQRFLVFEFMNRGSLDRTLFHGDPVLEWKERYAIALGTAKGLAYLHTGCEHKIIHCDVKPENILLHDKSQVKISDFGLSKLLSPDQSGLLTTLRGTRGYLAPEWLTSSAVSDKTDVYSYGMVLLEIIRGKKNSSPLTRSYPSGTDSHHRSSHSSGEGGHRAVYFPLFALEMHVERQYLELVDPKLMGRVTIEEVEKLVRVALCCVQEEPNLRPPMTNVVAMLEGGMELGEPRIESLNFLRFYGRRFSEESRLVEKSGKNEELFRQPWADSTWPYNSLSYISAQQVSGPR